MKTKLTVHLEKATLQQAEIEPPKENIANKLSGIINLSYAEDLKKAYTNYLEKKYT